jgi:hypothetical protein
LDVHRDSIDVATAEAVARELAGVVWIIGREVQPVRSDLRVMGDAVSSKAFTSRER